jgi:two-component sensor histidine kinase
MTFAEFFKAIRVDRPSILTIVGIGLGSIAAGTAIRFGIGTAVGRGIVPFATNYPAVLLATIIAGGWSGLIALIAGGAVAYFVFASAFNQFSVSVVAPSVSLTFYFLCGMMIIGIAVAYRHAMQQLEEESEKVRVLNHELQHRLRNTGAVIRAIMTRTLGSNHPKTPTLTRRIEALTATSVSVDFPQALTVGEIVARELAPFDNARIHAHGDDITIDRQSGWLVSLALHEFATNAAKYGALSNEQGELDVSWAQRGQDISFEWTERNGPTVKPPKGDGFGIALLKRALAECGGFFDMQFEPSGVVAKFSIPRRLD